MRSVFSGAVGETGSLMGDGSPSSGSSAALPHGTRHGDLSSIPLPLQDFQHLHPLRPHARAVVDYVGTIHQRKTVFHSRTAPSSHPAASVWPSGANATDWTAAG